MFQQVDINSVSRKSHAHSVESGRQKEKPGWDSPRARKFSGDIKLERERSLGPLSISFAVFAIPGDPAHVIAAFLPEPGLVVLNKTNALDPFGGLPRVKLRHD